jgi:hypothetical protein
MQLSGRRWVAAALTAVLAGSGLVAGSAQAFPPTNAWALGGYSHESITQHVMTDLAAEFFKATRSTRSMWDARKEVVEANAAVDDDQEHSALHFDGENFEGGQLRLQRLRSLTAQRLRADQPAKAREALGQALHTLQDFYTHTNWIELGNSTPNSALGRPGLTLGSVARPYEATCDGSDLLTDKLTSGYYSGEDRVPVVRGKCRHGGPLDRGPGDGGINKDMVDPTFSPHYDFHYEAVRVAELATAQFLRDIKGDVTESQLRSLFGLGPSLAIAIDNSSSMIDDQAKVAAQVNRIVRSRVGTAREPVSYVLVPFNDPVVGPVQKTDDPDTFLRAISSLPHRDTPTCPSLSMNGLLQAIQASSEGGEVYVITDADPLDPHLQYEATMAAKAKKIRVTPITFGRCETSLAKAAAATGEKTVTTEQAAPAKTDEPKADKASARELIRKAKAQEAARAKARKSNATKPNATKPSTTESNTVAKAGLGPTAPPAFTAYKTVANGTGGRMFALNSDEVDKIADLADQWTDDDTVSVLNADLILDRIATPFPFPVDSTMRKLYVYLEGLQDYPQRATLIRPDGIEIRPGQVGVEYPVSESEDRRMVVAIDQPMVGEWQLRVWGLGPVWATPASVRVTADSDLDLDNFAFVSPEVLDTENVHEYSGQADQTPPAGPVAVTAHLTADVASASFEFRSPEGVTQNTFGLPRSGTDYLGAATLPTADSVFYVRGTDAGGKAFQRTVAAPVQKPNPDLVVTPAPAQRLLPNTTVTRSVTVKNLGPASSFVIRQNSDQPYADGGYEYGQYFVLGAGQSGRIDYTVKVPDDVVAGTEATLTYSVRDLEDETNVAQAEVTLPVGPNLDRTPPVVQATTTPEPGPNGRFDGSTDVTVTLDATDAAGVKSVTYQVTYEDTREPETVVANRGAVIPVDGEGITTIRYKATDENGNESAYQTLDVHIESTPAGQVVSTTPDGDAVRVQTTRRGQKATVLFPGRAGQQVSVFLQDETFPRFSMPWSLIGPNGLVRKSDAICYYSCFIEPVTLPDDGDYRLVLDPVQDDIGSAEVRIYDVPEIPVVPTTLDGAAHRVTIAKPGQKAALSFTGRAGQRVTMVPSGHTFNNSDARFVFELPSGETITADGGLDVGLNDGGQYRPVELPEDGPYLMWVDPDDVSTGAVTVQLYDTADDVSVQLEPDADPVTLQTTTPGQQVRLTFRGEVGQRLSLALTDTRYVTDSFVIYDPDGRLLSGVFCWEGACRAAIPVIQIAGEYEVAYDGSWQHPLGFTAQLFDVSTDVTATAVIDGPPTTVTTLPGQQAAVSFVAEAGQVITLTTSFYSGDTVLRDPDGAEVVSDFCFFGCTFTDVTLPKAGRYTLAMDPFDNVAGPITVEVIDASPHDPGHTQRN